MRNLYDFYIKEVCNDDNTLYKGASMIGDLDKENVDEIVWERNNILYNITSPHAGNDFTYLVRVNPRATFDKWSNADLEMEFNTCEEAVAAVNNELGVYEKLLDLYIDSYMENLGR